MYIRGYRWIPTRRGTAHARIAVAFSIAILLVSCSGTKQRPNVILLSFCSVRADHLSCYGYPRETAPNIGAFAEKAVLFERAATQWPKTSPSFASIMTGTYPHTHGVMWKTPGVHLSDENVTLAELLRDAGYTTSAFVSSGALNRRLNINQGFDHFTESWKASERKSHPLALRYDLTAESALEWIDNHDSGPFFLWVHLNNAHYPYKAHPVLAEPFVNDALYADTLQLSIGMVQSIDRGLPADHPNAAQILHNDMGVIPKRGALFKDVKTRTYHRSHAHYIAQYDAGIRWADHSAAILLDGLKERGLLDEALVILVGDHGESLGDHDFYFEHGRFPYESCGHVPLMIRYTPLFEGGRRIGGPVGTFSIPPTVLDILGEPLPDRMESPSLLPAILEETEPPPFFSESGYEVDFQVSLRDGEWKLIHVPNPRDRSIMKGTEFELYHITDDPNESNNLIDREREIAANLISELLRWEEPWRASVQEVHTPENLQLDEATIRNLRGMGYLK